ncbi:hypothetical protein NIIDNTM18_42320 [Mycolicibacterium litorale]|uniref:Uncharacterized protein n=1 Tax=Mycolicibacterium litorale TaxID=758802 RepID=A0A6S6P8H2_9MYCO|nr:hypothetical protein [Mycolicibacterium litorale]BCI54954.1 hypothetical protein NIIDNTM18_42320 [Mycolicibacterium litorale]
MSRFATQHPILLVVGVILGCASLIAFWPIFLGLALVAALAGLLYKVSTEYDKNSLDAARRRRTLAAHADYEHHALAYGDPRGIYGQYPPAV